MIKKIPNYLNTYIYNYINVGKMYRKTQNA